MGVMPGKQQTYKKKQTGTTPNFKEKNITSFGNGLDHIYLHALGSLTLLIMFIPDLSKQ